MPASLVCTPGQTGSALMADHGLMERSLTQPSLSGMKADARWQAWVAKGQAHDDRVRYRARLIILAIASLTAVGLAVVLTVR